MSTENAVIVYHDKCADGVASAWICATYLQHNNIPYQCVPGAYGNESDVAQELRRIARDFDLEPETNVDNGASSPPPRVTTAYFVDVSLPKIHLLTLAQMYSRVVVLDHHKTSKDNLHSLMSKDAIGGVFDMNRAGCQITWDYFFPAATRPWFIEYVADRDLWRWELPDSECINAGFAALNIFNITALHASENKSKNSIQRIVCGEITYNEIKSAGQRRLDETRKLVCKLGETASPILFQERYPAVLVSCPFRELRSDLASHLLDMDAYKEYRIVIVYDYIPFRGTFSVSLRCRPTETTVDAAALAQQFGGGGHKTAAGMHLTPTQMTTLIRQDAE